MRYLGVVGALALLALTMPARGAEEIVVKMHMIGPDGIGKEIGEIIVEDGDDGLTFEPRLSGLTPGMHGMHIHENPDCGSSMKDGVKVAGLAAGGHWDPKKASKHLGPKGAGHAGDLPALKVLANGTSTIDELVTAPNLLQDMVSKRAIIIHAGGDNYKDEPAPLGGGGARIACGIIP